MKRDHAHYETPWLEKKNRFWSDQDPLLPLYFCVYGVEKHFVVPEGTRRIMLCFSTRKTPGARYSNGRGHKPGNLWRYLVDAGFGPPGKCRPFWWWVEVEK